MTTTHRYSPQGAARSLLECRDTEVLLSGPAGTGKSRACLEKLLLICLAAPNLRCLIVRKTQVSLANSALDTWRKQVATQFIANGTIRYYGGSNSEAPQYRFPNGSAIFVAGMDKPTRIMSTEFDVIYVQEAIELTETDWESLLTRLRNWQLPYQQLIADTNPDHAQHWLKQRCEAGQTTILESRHSDNPRLYNGDELTTEGATYMATLNRLTGVRRSRLRDGLWVSAEGVIWEDWDPAVHHIAPFKIPDEWERFLTVDFGYVHPFVAQWWAVNPDGKLYLYRELFHSKRLVEDHARQILHHSRKEPRWRSIITDHDAEDRATLERHLEASTTAAHKNVNDGIAAVATRLREQRLFIFRDSLIETDQDLVQAKAPTCTAFEIPAYVWDNRKEQPLKVNDDGCDALRYAVAARDLAGRFNVRFLG